MEPSSGANVIPRRIPPGLAGFRPQHRVMRTALMDTHTAEGLQGYLAHKKTPTPLATP